MYEQATLQEAYTGALIAGKGRTLNNINLIMERNRHRVEEWVRVRFGPGTPWRRCWCVISPPDEKEYQKAQKEWKKRSPYDRSPPPILKGDVKFFDTKISPKKQKRVKPLAKIVDSYSTYAIYPQAKSLIDASTLVKIEGDITYYLDPPCSKEGFVFVMPEVPPAVSGFEMLMRFLFPTWDIFGLYGRPGRLVASVLDQRSLMFAMPTRKRYGYLEILDVVGLISTEGSGAWSEREWRRKLKELTADRMERVDDSSSSNFHNSRGSRFSNRLSMGPVVAPGNLRPRVNFADEVGSIRSGRSMTPSQSASRTEPALATSRDRVAAHGRNNSDPQGITVPQNPLGYAADFSPSHSPARGVTPNEGSRTNLASTPEGRSSEEDLPRRDTPLRELEENVRNLSTPEPVSAPPLFSHPSDAIPTARPYQSAELLQAKTRLSHTTLAQMINSNNGPTNQEARNERSKWDSDESPVSSSGYSDRHAQVVQALANPVGMLANVNGPREALRPPSQDRAVRPRSPLVQSSVYPPEIEEASPPIQVFIADFPGASSSRSNSMGSQKHAQIFYRSVTPPVPSPVGPSSPIPEVSHGPPPENRNPGRTATVKNEMANATPTSEFSTPSLADLVVDPAALDQIQLEPDSDSDYRLARKGTYQSGVSSVYENTSTDSPDYASTVQSEKTAESVERPRIGVLRTVGDVNHDAPTSNPEMDFPEINFGPTLNLAAPRVSQDKSPSQGSLGQGGLNPYLAGPPGQQTPPSDLGHSRQASDNTVRWAPWHPAGSPAGVGSSARPMSPEEFVQQRASQTPTYQYHQRQASGSSSLRRDTPTPPLNRPGSFDPAQARTDHSRNGSVELVQRPSSRGASSVLNISTNLSAREQEQVARMTGSSLIQVDGRRPAPQGSGLVGAIAQREREREQMKQGFGNQAVQQAIHQRQQAQANLLYQQQLQQQQMQQQFYQQQQMYGTADASAPSVYSGIVSQSQPRQMYSGMAQQTQAAAQAFAQGGGWSRPNMNQAASRASQGYLYAEQAGPGGRGYFPGQQFQGQAF